MKKIRSISRVVLLLIALAGLLASSSLAEEHSKYLDAVREFADNVLKYGRDTYGPKHTPLFIDGLNAVLYATFWPFPACPKLARRSFSVGGFILGIISLQPSKICLFFLF